VSRLSRVVSGGQTGVDRAALDAARAAGLAIGGWCPRGRRAEDGRIPPEYPLEETPSPRYPERTGWNVRDSGATLVLARGAPRGGSALTVRLAEAAGRPLLVVDLAVAPDPAAVVGWLAAHLVEVLNVAGPRESENPGIGAQARRFLEAVFALLREGESDPPGPTKLRLDNRSSRA
jgi:hypothetical protein